MGKTFVAAALLAVFTLALAGCGGSDEEGSGTSATAAPTTAAADGTTVAVANRSLGDILVDAEGRTLYAFTKDKGDQSACSGQCADNWPAVIGPAAVAGTGVQAALLSSAIQADGSFQVTYGGKPLYYFPGDVKAGDTNGQGVGGRVVRRHR